VNAVTFSPDGSRIASASYDRTVKVWDARTGAEVLALRGHTNWVNAVSYSPDGARIATASLDRTVKIWDARKGELLRPYDPWAEAQARYEALAPSWHLEDAEAAEKAGDTFAARFHRRWLAEYKPGEVRK
jgi:WD40 repeat protein